MIYPSPLSNFSLQRNNPVKKLFRLDLDSNASFSTPIQTVPGNQRDFKQFFTKTAGDDGWIWPDSLADSFGDGHADRVSVYLNLKPETDVYLASAPYLSDYIENTVAEIPTNTADALAVREALAYDGMSPNYLETRVKQRVTGNPQTPLTIVRGPTYYTGMMSEIREFYHTCFFRLDPDIAAKMTSVGKYQVFGCEIKTGGLRTAAAPTTYQYGVGSFRLATNLLMFGNGLGLQLYADNNANGVGDPGLPLIPTVVPYWSKNTLIGGYPDPDRPITPGIWYKLELSHRRSLSYSDLTTGRTWLALTDMSTGVRKKYLEQIGGVHMGVYGDPITRIFLQNPYSSADMPVFNWSCGHQMYDKCPFNQE